MYSLYNTKYYKHQLKSILHNCIHKPYHNFLREHSIVLINQKGKWRFVSKSAHVCVLQHVRACCCRTSQCRAGLLGRGAEGAMSPTAFNESSQVTGIFLFMLLFIIFLIKEQAPASCLSPLAHSVLVCPLASHWREERVQLPLEGPRQHWLTLQGRTLTARLPLRTAGRPWENM